MGPISAITTNLTGERSVRRVVSEEERLMEKDSQPNMTPTETKAVEYWNRRVGEQRRAAKAYGALLEKVPDKTTQVKQVLTEREQKPSEQVKKKMRSVSKDGSLSSPKSLAPLDQDTLFPEVAIKPLSTKEFLEVYEYLCQRFDVLAIGTMSFWMLESVFYRHMLRHDDKIIGVLQFRRFLMKSRKKRQLFQ